MKEKIAVGLDIGTSNIRVVVGTFDEKKKLEIIGLGTSQSFGIVRGGISNIDKATESIDFAIKEAESTSGVNINVVNINFNDHLISSESHIGSLTRQNLDTEITIDDVKNLRNDIYRTLVSPGREIVQVLPQTYKVDYKENIKDPVGMSGIRLDGIFEVITADSPNIKSVHKCLQKIGVTTNNTIISPLATSIATLTKEEKYAGVCIIDLGAGTTQIAVFQDYVIKHIEILPFGGQLITDDIKQACTIMPIEAELIKKNFGSAFSAGVDKYTFIEVPRITGKASKQIPLDTLALIIESRIMELVEIINSRILFNKFSEGLPAGIVLVGGGSKLKGIAELFESITGIETRIGDILNTVTNSFLSNEFENLSCAVGLVLSEFNPLDYRDEYYLNKKKFNKQEDSKIIKKKEGFLKNIWIKAKSILIDDYDE